MFKATHVRMEELGIVLTVGRSGRTIRIVVHSVRRDGRHMGSIEFRNVIIGIGTHGATARHGVCISGGPPSGDRCISGGGGQPLGGDLDAGGCAHIVVSHGGLHGEGNGMSN
jgi:hypothetical protein